MRRLLRFRPRGSTSWPPRESTFGRGPLGLQSSSPRSPPFIAGKQTIQDGSTGARQTLQAMAQLARKGLRDQRIRNLAVALTTDGFLSGTGLQQKDFEGEARTLHEFVRDQIRYVRDTDGVELLHDPVTLLQIGAGDCDDKAILLASLLGSIGHPTRFVAVAFEPDCYSHVWVQDYLNGAWVDLEPTEPLPFGRTVPLSGAVSTMEQEV